MASSSKAGKSKPNDIMAKMREKAAAEKNTENVAPMKPTESAKHASMTASKPTTKKRGPQVETSATSSQPGLKPSSTALKSILDPANKPSPVKESTKKPSQKKPVVEKPLSPMQTYEMSDREADSDSESESDEEEYERQRPKKAVSQWCTLLF